MKFNKYCEKHSLPSLSIFDMNDIVGLTVSVTYPSDINIVCAYIDELCETADQKVKLYPKFFSEEDSEKTNEKNLLKIKTKYGTVKNERGYFACHYCLRTNDTPNDPIVEVQIKTVLHDAWGLKTHDLTYKNPFPIDDNTSNSFAMLGDALSNLDMQSDFLRRSIRKGNAFREAKKREVQVELTLHGPGCISISELAFQPRLEKARAYVNKLKALARGEQLANSNEIADLRKEAISFCITDSNECCCRLLCALAVITGDTQAQLDALERIELWSDNETDNIMPKKQKHIAKFYFGDIGGAIDAAEDALKFIKTIYQNRKDVVDDVDSVMSSLAYYYAELVGTDEGNKRNAHQHAVTYRNDSRACLQKMGMIDDATKDWPQLIEGLLARFRSINSADAANQKLLSHLFNIIDNAIFGEIQTSNDPTTVREALKWLEQLVAARPSMLASPAKLSHDLHTHCARIRLLEFEAQMVGVN
jgi:ppGpp synthetase/RelA/SpoT-type nucleotidyltranferase